MFHATQVLSYYALSDVITGSLIEAQQLLVLKVKLQYNIVLL